MKKIFIAILFTIFLFGCTKKEPTNLVISAPEGTPALSIARLTRDGTTIGDYNVTYNIVKPSNIALEMSSQKSDIVIMPVNVGANLVRQGAPYKLIGVAVDGNIYVVGKSAKDNITLQDLLGKKVACIGQTGIPGIVFRYILQKNGISFVTDNEPSENEIFIQYVADASVARVLLADKDNGIDFAVIAEPASTAFLNQTALELNVCLDLQEEYKKCSDNHSSVYPQAGIFIKNTLYNDDAFIEKFFIQLENNKDWILENKSSVTEYAQQNLYSSASFPPASIEKCGINCKKITEENQDEIITFLQNIMPKDSNNNKIDWATEKDKLF